ncbi:unnamed protein product [Echinostoma caproni]|uniref:Uncharacterized protein n=1 Tax=Echinostoma caproni TaxID=27848 RepID=A0A183B7H0_9TREM|nr:unnamed protein product [Echinostoma caproni]
MDRVRLFPLCIGHPARFGPHLLLTSEDFEVLWRLLKCRHCSFRRLYHKLVVQEKSPPRDLHSLTRAIKAVLKGFCLNRHCVAKVVLTSNQTSVFPPKVGESSDCLTVLKTSVSLQKEFVVCFSHGRELFAHLYCWEDGASTGNSPNSGVFSGVRNLIPEGRSSFFRSSLAHDDSGDEEDTGACVSGVIAVATATVQKPTVHIVSVSGQGVLTTVQTKTEDCRNDTLTQIHLVSDYQRIVEANAKWSAFYGSENHTPSIRPDVYSSSRCPHRARFPDDSPVSSVRYMRTYFVALSLERRNRVWETEARERVYARFRQLVSSGCDPSKASELAERGGDWEDEDEDECAVPSSCVPSYIPATSTDPIPVASKTVRKKRCKRRKKTNKKRLTPPVSQPAESWSIKSNDCSSFSTFYPSPISCELGGSAQW